MADNRQHPRHLTRLPVTFQVAGGERIAASCADISLGGMFVETESPAPYGAQLVVHVALPGLKEEAALAATVRWVKKGAGMGLQFGVMGARETHAIVQLLREGSTV